ncbi:MAG: alkene reductase [Gammaproteobacteria bacterium]|nr:alkene reductase [Gammaproteobacteria bacterium]
MSTSRLLSALTTADGLPLPNRVVMAPMTRARAGAERIPNAAMATYYAQRASAGLIITEATVVSEQGIGWLESPGIYNAEHTAGWRDVVAAVHARGGRVFLQLWHCGRASHRYFFDDERLPVAPSAIAIANDASHTPRGKFPYETPRALASDEIPGIVDDYRQAARRARDAGFDGVEVHAANGYLLDQFLQAKTNQRDDAYGGSIDNRYRLLGEVVAAVAESFAATRISVRLSPNGVFNDMGTPEYRELFGFAATRLAAAGIGFLHIMDGLGFGFHELGEPMTLAEFRALFPRTLIGNVGYTQQSAEQAIAAGHADMIAFGRPYISNPDLVERFANGWPLAPEADMSTWYSPQPGGYIDWPAHAG